MEVIRAGGHPIVYGDWLHADADAPTVLIYGHYDVQPVDPLELWHSPPFEPSVRGEDLFARGASDDKGQLFAHVAAVEALLSTYGELPVNVKFLVEGEEEVGSRALTAYLPSETEKLAADVCLISDTHILAPDLPLIIYGLRGMWAGEIIVRGPSQDLHSGMFGGAVHNPNQALCALLAQLHDSTGRITVPGFYDDVQALSAEERTALAQVPYDEDKLIQESGVPAAWAKMALRLPKGFGRGLRWRSMEIWGGFIGDGFKTVIPPKPTPK